MRTLLVCLAILAGFWALWVLEGARAGITIERLSVGATPVVRYSDGSGGPVVVVAHGFAGSQQMMQGYALPLAQAGLYRLLLRFRRARAPPGPDVRRRQRA